MTTPRRSTRASRAALPTPSSIAAPSTTASPQMAVKDEPGLVTPESMDEEEIASPSTRITRTKRSGEYLSLATAHISVV